LGDGVVVPPGLCRVVARLALLGLADRGRRDGGAPVVPGLAQLLGQLDAAGNGHAPATVVLPSWVTAGEAAEVMGLSRRSVRRLAASGRLIARRPGHEWQVDRQSAEDYARRRRATG
jgi:excisionase family DNA binding protein